MAKAKAKARARKATKPSQVKLVGKDKNNGTVLVRIKVDGKTLVISTGSAWGSYKDKTKTYGSPEKAREAYEKALATKREAGFYEVGALAEPAVKIVRDAELEAAIRANRDDDGVYMVYADWLQDQGSPLGDLIAFAQRGKKKEAEKLAKKVGVPDPEFAKVTSKHGLWQSLKIDNEIDNSDGEWDPLPPIRKLFESPLCAVLDELRIGMVRWDFFDQPKIIAAAGELPWAKDLRSLAVGDVDGIDMMHHAIGDVGKHITKAFPKLRSLFLHSGAQSWRDSGESFGTSGLELPQLEKLVVETCVMSAKRVKGFFGGLPNATFVELWFGDPDYDQPLARVGDLMPIFTGAAFPKLEHLGLCNTKLVTEIVRFLPTTKIAKQLTGLDLSRGTFWDEDATELAAEAKAFGKLTAIDVSRSFLTKAGIATLKKAFPKATITADRQNSLDNVDEDYGGRYVAVSE